MEELRAFSEVREVPTVHLPHIIVAECAGALAGFATVLPGKGAVQVELEKELP